MADYDLDLDLLQPQGKKVQLNGKIYDVYPPRVKDITELARLAGSMSEDKDAAESLGAMVGVLARFMPALKEDDVDISIEQMKGLMQFINTLVTPDSNGATKQLGITTDSGEKKSPSA